MTDLRSSAPDLLSGLNTPADSDTESFDLLGGLTEGSATAWRPDADNTQPQGIQGVVKTRGTVTHPSYGDSEMIELDTADGTFSVRAYGTVLKSLFDKNDPQPGDFFAIKYLGMKQGKNNSYKNYAAAKRAKGTF